MHDKSSWWCIPLVPNYYPATLPAAVHIASNNSGLIVCKGESSAFTPRIFPTTRLRARLGNSSEYISESSVSQGAMFSKWWCGSWSSGRTLAKKKKKAIYVSFQWTLPNLYPHQWYDAYFLKNFTEKSRHRKPREKFDPDLSQASMRLKFRNAHLLPKRHSRTIRQDFWNLLYNHIQYTPEQLAPLCHTTTFSWWSNGKMEDSTQDGIRRKRNESIQLPV